MAAPGHHPMTPSDEDHALDREPEPDAQERERGLQHGRGARLELQGEVGILREAQRLDRERRGRVRSQHEGRIDDGKPIDQDGEKREPQLRVEARHDDLGEGGDAAITERARRGEGARRIRLRQGGERHQEQEGDFLHDQAGRKRQPPGIVDDQEVGRALIAGRPGGQKAKKEA